MERNETQLLVSSSELARILGLSVQYLGQLSSRGVIPKHSRGRWDLTKVIPAYLAHVKRERGTGAFYRHQELRARQLELQLERDAGNLVSAVDVEREAAELGRRLRDGILTLPARLDAILANESRPARIRKVLTGELERVLAILSKGRGSRVRGPRRSAESRQTRAKPRPASRKGKSHASV